MSRIKMIHFLGSWVQGQDVHRHPRVLHGQEDHGHDARQEGHLTQLRAVPKTQSRHFRDRSSPPVKKKENHFLNKILIVVDILYHLISKRNKWHNNSVNIYELIESVWLSSLKEKIGLFYAKYHAIMRNSSILREN